MQIHKPYDALIVGGGHNGLICACYLAAAGLKVRVLERRAVVGGAAVTEEFFPGFRNSTAAYTVSLLHPKVIRDLRLAEHGLKIVERPIAEFPAAFRPGLSQGRQCPGPDADRGRRGSRRATPSALPDYYAMLERVAGVLRDLAARDAAQRRRGRARRVRGAAHRQPPAQGSTWPRAARRARSHSPRARATCSTPGSSPSRSRPHSASTRSSATSRARTRRARAYVLLHHVFGEVNGKRGAWGHAIGGMGAITQAMAKEAERRGVEITTECEVARVSASTTAARSGVQLADGSDGRRALRRRQRQSEAAVPEARRRARARRRLRARACAATSAARRRFA